MYSNKDFHTIERNYGSRPLRLIRLGQTGRGRCEGLICCPEDCQTIPQGDNPGWTIRRGLYGQARLVAVSRPESIGTFLLLSSKKAYPKQGSGRIYTLAHRQPQILVRALGACGQAGRVGNWPEYLIRAYPGDAFAVQWSGHRYGWAPTVYFVGEDLRVYSCNLPDLPVYCDGAGVKPPFTITVNDGIAGLKLSEWQRL